MRTQSIRLLYSLLAHLLLIAAALAAQQQCGGLRRLDHPALQGPNATCREYRRVCFDQVGACLGCWRQCMRAAAFMRTPCFMTGFSPSCRSCPNPRILQGSVISYNEAHSPRNRNSVRIPQLNITHLAYNWGGDGEGGNTDRLRYALSFYPPLAFRAGAGALEASPDLREPRFEACAAPLVMWTMVGERRGSGGGCWQYACLRVHGFKSGLDRIAVPAPENSRAMCAPSPTCAVAPQLCRGVFARRRARVGAAERGRAGARADAGDRNACG